MHFADNRNKIGKYIPAVVFLIFIYGMALWFIFSPKPDYSSSEKRYLQKFPEVTAVLKSEIKERVVALINKACRQVSAEKHMGRS